MTTTTTEIYQPYVSVRRVVSLATPTITAGVQVDVADDGSTTVRQLRQRAKVVTDVQFVATMRWRRQVVTVRTPELPVAAEAQPVFWDTDEVLWDTEEVVWQ